MRRIAHAVAQTHKTDDLTHRIADISRPWEETEFREERYAAQDLLALHPAKARLDLLDLHEYIARCGAWWDYTDEQGHRVARPSTHILKSPTLCDAGAPTRVFWVRRIAIIGQLGRREPLDRDLLAEVIEPNLDNAQFFIRKAIGWAVQRIGSRRAMTSLSTTMSTCDSLSAN